MRVRNLPACISGSVAVLSMLTVLPGRSYSAPKPPPENLAALSKSTPSSAEFRVTWQDIIKLVDNHPRITAGRHRTAAARAGVDAASAIPNPSLEATTSYGQTRGGPESRIEWGLALSIPLGWIVQRGAKMDAADAASRVIDAESKALRRDVLLQLRIMFWNLVYEQERVAALRELDRQTAELAKTVKTRVEKGAVRPVEATRVEVESEKIVGEFEVARSALGARRDQLAAWLGTRPGQTPVAIADLTELPQPMTAKRAREKARSEHPTVLAARARVQAFSANVTVERRIRVPSVAIEAFTDHELDRRAYGLGLSIDLPLWNWNTESIQRSENMLAASKKQLEAERLEIETAAIESQAACQAGVKLAKRYKDRILPLAQSAAATIERTYQLGEATLLEAIDARRTLLETRREFLSALIQAQTDCSRLRAVAGEELPQNLPVNFRSIPISRVKRDTYERTTSKLSHQNSGTAYIEFPWEVNMLCRNVGAPMGDWGCHELLD